VSFVDLLLRCPKCEAQEVVDGQATRPL
jgi:cytochrome c-type biogenesis protein CcmH/NrfF